MSKSITIRNARVIDPAAGTDDMRDLYIDNGIIAAAPARGAMEIDATGLVAAPGFIDIHVHFREPGFEQAETIETGSAAAAAGGFTTVVTMPNTSPATDSAEMIRFILDKAAAAGKVRVLPSGCLSCGRDALTQAPMMEMKDAGAAAFTDDGSTIEDIEVLRGTMLTAASLDTPVLDHAVIPSIAGNGVIRDCAAAEGHPVMPAKAEIEAVRRDIALSSETGCRMHIQHLSTKGAVELIRQARADGIRVSAEASPHHVALSTEDIDPTDADYKMNPPLGTPEDSAALRQALMDGTIEAFATDHAPHTAESKSKGFTGSSFGIIGLETAIGVTYSCMVLGEGMSIADWISRWTSGPASVLGLKPPSLEPGSPADIVLIDLSAEWQVDADSFHSLSRNTPFKGRTLTARAIYTILEGTLTHGG